MTQKQLDEATKAKYCEMYTEFMSSWTTGAMDLSKIKKEVGKNLADDLVFKNADLPDIVGKQTFIDHFDAWASVKTLIHSPDTIFCDNNSWVTIIGTFCNSGVKADGETMFAHQARYCNRVHFNAAGKIDIFESHWDAGEGMKKMA